MGKKKSVVLMVLLNILIIALTVFTVSPTFWFPWNDGLNGWNSPLGEFIDFGSDFKGGYYTYYYPDGVYSEAQYQSNLENYSDEVAEGETQSPRDKYAEGFIAHKGLRLSTDSQYGLVKNGKVNDDFVNEMQRLRNVISDRYSARGYSSFRVAVVDDYAFRVELPAADALYESTFELFSYMGAVNLKIGDTAVEELEEEGVSINDYITNFTIGAQYNFNYIRVNLTQAGKDLIGEKKDSLSTQSSNDTSTTMYICVGDTKILPVYQDNVRSDNLINCAYLEGDNKAQLDTMVVLLNSALEHGEFSVTFSGVSSEIREMENLNGENLDVVILLVLAAITLACIVAMIVKYRRYGVVAAYMTLSYLIVTGLCFAFISGGIFEFTLGSALVYLFVLVLMNVLHAMNYHAIKKQFDLGKTVDSSVMLGYKSTIWLTVDIYAVLLLGALAMLIGAAGVQIMALQAIICLVAGAFCNLLWGRLINYIYLSTQKNKFKYFGFVREDDDDE
ncbi:MAG: hypothetical protein IJX98_02485 [Clostridia bacterium]|nr:hypothetical protein [Clostridia bacterium]